MLNTMDNVMLRRLSYSELDNTLQISDDDKYHMLSGYLTPAVKHTLLANPNLSDITKSAINLIIYDGCIVGRNMLMPTKIKIDNRIIEVQSGGSYEVSKECQGHGFGTLAFRDSIFNSEYDMYIGQLYSTTAIAIVKKLGLITFELPSFYKLCKSHTILESKGLHGVLLGICEKIIDVALEIKEIPNLIRLKKLKKCFAIKQEMIIPSWVNDITLNDGHIYSEIHDREWLQWCLDNKFTERAEDHQSFFAVYDKQGKPKGFFMTKLRIEKNQGKYKNITRGTIVEWGSYNEDELNEIDLNLLAIDSFDENVDNITTILSDSTKEKKIKKLGFIRHGEYQMTVNPGTFDNVEIADKTKWRIRYGGCNTIIY